MNSRTARGTWLIHLEVINEIFLTFFIVAFFIIFVFLKLVLFLFFLVFVVSELVLV